MGAVGRRQGVGGEEGMPAAVAASGRRKWDGGGTSKEEQSSNGEVWRAAQGMGGDRGDLSSNGWDAL